MYVQNSVTGGVRFIMSRFTIHHRRPRSYSVVVRGSDGGGLVCVRRRRRRTAAKCNLSQRIGAAAARAGGCGGAGPPFRRSPSSVETPVRRLHVGPRDRRPDRPRPPPPEHRPRQRYGECGTRTYIIL